MAEPVRETLIWGPFACALVPVALIWSGSRWPVAIGVGALIALLALLCWGALLLSGVPLRHPHPHDER